MPIVKPASRITRQVVERVSYAARSARRRLAGDLPVYFCMNSGRCGSASLVRFLQSNRVLNCFHEKRPDLLQEGLLFHAGELSRRQAVRRISATRRGVFFEANNRLFSLAHPIKEAFPNARFVFLHRDGRQVVRSGMQRRWFQHDDRFGKRRLGADQSSSPFVKCCRYWASVNQRILEDLSHYPDDTLTISFEGLTNGNDIQRVAAFLDIQLTHPQVFPQHNRTTTWSISSYDKWPVQWRQQFDEICGPTMDRLGYPWTPPTGMDTAPVASSHKIECHSRQE